VTEVALIDRGWEPGQRSKQRASFLIMLQYDTVACSKWHPLIFENCEIVYCCESSDAYSKVTVSSNNLAAVITSATYGHE
jgi:hypothetical protein